MHWPELARLRSPLAFFRRHRLWLRDPPPLASDTLLPWGFHPFPSLCLLSISFPPHVFITFFLKHREIFVHDVMLSTCLSTHRPFNSPLGVGLQLGLVFGLIGVLGRAHLLECACAKMNYFHGSFLVLGFLSLVILSHPFGVHTY